MRIIPGSESSLKTALEKKAASTCHLVSSFTKSSGRDEDLHSLERAQTEVGRGLRSGLRVANGQRQCITLRSELALAHAQVADLQSQRDNFYNDLIAAETRVDRLQSRTVQTMHSHAPPIKELGDEESERSKSNGGPSDDVLKSSPPSVCTINYGMFSAVLTDY